MRFARSKLCASEYAASEFPQCSAYLARRGINGCPSRSRWRSRRRETGRSSGSVLMSLSTPNCVCHASEVFDSRHQHIGWGYVEMAPEPVDIRPTGDAA